MRVKAFKHNTKLRASGTKSFKGSLRPSQNKISTFSQSLVPRSFVQVVFSFGGHCIFLSGPVLQALCLNTSFVSPLATGGCWSASLQFVGQSFRSTLVLHAGFVGNFSSSAFSGMRFPFQSSLFRGLFSFDSRASTKQKTQAKLGWLARCPRSQSAKVKPFGFSKKSPPSDVG